MKRLIKEKKIGSLNLELLGYDCWWQKPTEVVRFALPFVEGKPLVVARIPQQIVTTAPRARAQTQKKSQNFRTPNQAKKNSFVQACIQILLF